MLCAPMAPVNRQVALVSNAPNDLQTSNDTSNRFLGIVQKSWMQPGFRYSPIVTGIVGEDVIASSRNSAGAGQRRTEAGVRASTPHIPPRQGEEAEAEQQNGWPVTQTVSLSTAQRTREEEQEQIRAHAKRTLSGREGTNPTSSAAQENSFTKLKTTLEGTATSASTGVAINLDDYQAQSLSPSHPTAITVDSSRRTSIGITHTPDPAMIPTEDTSTGHVNIGGGSAGTTSKRKQRLSLDTDSLPKRPRSLGVEQSIALNLQRAMNTTSASVNGTAHPMAHPNIPRPNSLPARPHLPATPTSTPVTAPYPFAGAHSTQHPTHNMTADISVSQLPSPPVTLRNVPTLPQTTDLNGSRGPVSLSMPTPTSDSPRTTLKSFPKAFPPITSVTHFRAKVAEMQRSMEFDLDLRYRLFLVDRAMVIHDEFYLAFHQLFCLWTTEPDWVLSSFDLTPSQHQAMQFFEVHLMPNRQVPRDVLVVLSRLRPPDDLRTNPSRKLFVPRIKLFLDSLGPNLQLLWQVCADGQAPPSAHLIAHYLHCVNSPVLQKFFFEAILRYLFGPLRQDFTRAVLQLFDANQHEFLQRLRQGFQYPSRNLFGEPDVQNFRNGFERLRKSCQQPLLSPAGQGPQVGQATGSSIPTNSGPFAQTIPLFPVTPQSIAQPHTRSRPAHTAHHRPSQIRSQTQSSLIHHEDSVANVSTLPAAGAVTQQTSMHAQRRDAPRPAPGFLPPQGQSLPVTVDNNSDRTALHQAHLKSPSFKFASPRPTSIASPQVFTFFKSFLMSPRLIDSASGYLVQDVNAPTDLVECRPKEVLPSSDDVYGQRVRLLDATTVLFRLRCVALAKGNKDLDETSWLEMPTRWPECGFFSFNGKHIEVRRKIHHQKDLSADISLLLTAGTNKLEVSYHPIQAEDNLSFALAIEVTHALTRDAVACMPQVIDARSGLDAITSVLSSQGKDEDVTAIDPYISIDLVDPFTSHICSRPVRGKQCVHRECFDLETFLGSRVSRGKNNVISPDSFQCPICRCDARPNNLIIDGFLLSVSEQLRREGKTQVRAILVRQDGTWSPKLETGGANGNEEMPSQSTLPVKDISEIQHISRPGGTGTDIKLAIFDTLTVPTRTASEPIVIELDDG